MTQTKHTQGPWKHAPKHAKLEIEDIHRDGFEAICTVSNRDFFKVYVSGQDRAERLSNAALISAAPELLEALELAVHALNRVPNFKVNCLNKDIKDSYQIASICDQTIAKAKGGECGNKLVRCIGAPEITEIEIYRDYIKIAEALDRITNKQKTKNVKRRKN